jgi:RsiW-degrading membrane proteinase PrsW (M82 family)
LQLKGQATGYLIGLTTLKLLRPNYLSFMTNDSANSNSFFPTLSRFHECVLVFAAIVCGLAFLELLHSTSNILGAAAPGIFWLLLLWRKPPTKKPKTWLFANFIWGIVLLGVALGEVHRMLP